VPRVSAHYITITFETTTFTDIHDSLKTVQRSIFRPQQTNFVFSNDKFVGDMGQYWGHSSIRDSWCKLWWSWWQELWKNFSCSVVLEFSHEKRRMASFQQPNTTSLYEAIRKITSAQDVHYLHSKLQEVKLHLCTFFEPQRSYAIITMCCFVFIHFTRNTARWR
jgi:hypothetical protein